MHRGIYEFMIYANNDASKINHDEIDTIRKITNIFESRLTDTHLHFGTVQSFRLDQQCKFITLSFALNGKFCQLNICYILWRENINNSYINKSKTCNLYEHSDRIAQ